MTKTSLVFLSALALAGCPEDDDTTPATTAAPPTTAEPATTATTDTSTATTDLQVDTGDKNPAITARVKSELDGREDGSTGAAITVAGGRATFSSVTGWKDAKSGSFSTSESADGKARFAAGTSTGGRDGVSGAMGLSNCQWNPDETVTTGKDKLSASVADGICDRGAGKAVAASATFSGENVVAVGAWDQGSSDDAAVFSIMRSSKKAAGGGDATGIAACCQALKQNSVSAPPEQKGAYLAAFGACQAAISTSQGRAALAGIRAMLAGAGAPPACQ
jgi:hypothetical protein